MDDCTAMVEESNNIADLTVSLMALALGALQGTFCFCNLQMLSKQQMEERVQCPKPEQLKRTTKNFSWESPSGVITLLATRNSQICLNWQDNNERMFEL